VPLALVWFAGRVPMLPVLTGSVRRHGMGVAGEPVRTSLRQRPVEPCAVGSGAGRRRGRWYHRAPSGS